MKLRTPCLTTPPTSGLRGVTPKMYAIDTRFSKEFIQEGLRVVLKNNHFHFDNEFYLHIKGTAMGTKVAPTYATLEMGHLEDQLYNRQRILTKVFANISKLIGSVTLTTASFFGQRVKRI